MSESFDEFVSRMSRVEKDRELRFGRAHEGNSRAVFTFEGHMCFLESFGFRTRPERDRSQPATPAEMLWAASAEPSERWILGDWVKGRRECERLAKAYGGDANPDEYHEDDMDAWYLSFDEPDGFEKMMRVIWDYKSGALPPETFPWIGKPEQEG
jgi:hypothetical protein